MTCIWDEEENERFPFILFLSLLQQFDDLEDPVRRKVFTSSIAGAKVKGTTDLSRMRGFELVPGEVHFGTLREGCTYAFQVNLKNVGVDSCRYKIKQPPPSTGLQVVYAPGPVSMNFLISLPKIYVAWYKKTE